MRRVPESLRLVGVLLALGVAGAAASYAVQEYQANDKAKSSAEALTGGHMDAGKRAIAARQCGACHEIPGVVRSRGQVGPSLKGVAGRKVLAGMLRNDPAAMVRWIRYPQSVVPGNAMPDMGIGDAEARDIAAYLYTLRPTPS